MSDSCFTLPQPFVGPVVVGAYDGDTTPVHDARGVEIILVAGLTPDESTYTANYVAQVLNLCEGLRLPDILEIRGLFAKPEKGATHADS